MQTNGKMRALLGALGSVSRSPQLQALLASPVVHEDGCLFLAPLRAGAASLDRNALSDRTGAECFVNHIHVSDFMETPPLRDLDVLAHGLGFAQELLTRFRAEGPVVIIVSYDGEDCTVRFHRSRAGENWLAADLEGYVDEAIAVLGPSD